jgi:single-stranded DNA-binding protein
MGLAASRNKETVMQNVTFVGRLSADPQVTEDFGKAVFRLLENRGHDASGAPRVVGVNCVSWVKGLNETVIAEGLASGCEVVVVGTFVDNVYEARDGGERAAKELVVRGLTVLDWASARETPAERPAA